MVALALLSGCLGGGSNFEPIAPETAAEMLIEYDPEFQARAAEEVAALPADSAVAVLVEHYGVVREQLRALGRGAGRQVRLWVLPAGEPAVGDRLRAN